jgi:malonyl-CoA/methylmalonyl-CoA synthetase
MRNDINLAMSENLFTHFASIPADPVRDFIVMADRPALSFQDVFALAGRFANVFAAHGVKKGDRVAAQVEKSPEALCLYLACLRLGAVYLPLNPGYTLNEVRYFVGDAEPRLFICSPGNEEAIRPLLGGAALLSLGDDGAAGTLNSEARKASGDFADVAVSSDDLAAILYTSGTTGRSKGAMLTHGNLRSNAETLKDVWRFTDQDVLLHALPVFHIHGLFVATNVCLAAGAAMILLPKFDPEQIFHFLPRATVLMGVPTFYTRLLRDPRLTGDAARHMRLFISGSAPLLAETHRQWKERTGHAVLERYGMTETNMNTSNPYDGKRVAGSVGLPLPGVDVRITGEDGRPLATGDVGMIEVRGPNVFKGYWRMPEKTAAEFRADGFFITGDLGMIDADGYVHIIGRGKDLIITGGFNVYPKEIESLIDDLPGVEESAVIGLPHDDFGEGVTALVVKKAGAELSEADVLSALSIHLAKFKQPKRVLFVDQFPRNTMGKVQKAAMRAEWAVLYRG